MTTTAITNIGSLVTNDPAAGDGSPLGLVQDAAVVIDGDKVAWVGPAAKAPAADEVFDAQGRAVIPGFVDSHSHLVFAGDRTQEFNARMSGRAYSAGGIRTTVAATRAATDAELEANLVRHLDEARRQGTTTFETKSGYGLTVADEARALRIAAAHTEEVTYLGAHIVSPTSPRTRRATSTSSPARCWRPAPRTPAGWTSSARRAPSTATRPARSSPPAPPPG